MNSAWMTQARHELLRLAEDRPGWGYRPTGAPFVEPTVLACCGLLATEPDGAAHPSASVIGRAVRWIVDLQQADGAVGLSEHLTSPCWTTSLAILLWATQPGTIDARRKAVDWLLRQEGKTAANTDEIIGHDRSIAGWSWVADTHSWLEPTALAVLALHRTGRGAHRRTQDGLRLIRDREVPGGGWNFGNTTVFGNAFRPQPGPTGLALLVLAAAREPHTDAIERGCRYLETLMRDIRSAQSLCWGLLGLSAWNRRPAEADRWLAEAHPPASRRADAPLQLAYLLLASAPNAPRLLGIDHRK